MSFLRAASEILTKNHEISSLLEGSEMHHLKEENQQLKSTISNQNFQIEDFKSLLKQNDKQIDSLLNLISELKEVNLRLKSDKETLEKARFSQEKFLNAFKKKLEALNLENQRKIQSLTSTHKQEVFDLQQTIKLLSVQNGNQEKLPENVKRDKIPDDFPINEEKALNLMKDPIITNISDKDNNMISNKDNNMISNKDNNNLNASPQSQEPPYFLKTMNKLNKRINELSGEIEILKLEKKSLDSQKESFLHEKLALENINKLMKERYEASELEKRRLDDENANLKGNNKFLEARNDLQIKELEALKLKHEILEKDYRKLELELHEKIINETFFNKKNLNNFNSNNEKDKEINKEMALNAGSNQENAYMLKTVNKLNKKINDFQAEIETLKLEKKNFETHKESLVFEKLSLENSNKILHERIENLEKERKSLEEDLFNIKSNSRFLQEKNDENLKEIINLKEKIDNSAKDIHSKVLINAMNSERIENTQEKEASEPQYIMKTMNKLNKKISLMTLELESLKLEKKTLENLKESLFQEKIGFESDLKILKEKYQDLDFSKKQLEVENLEIKGNNKNFEAKNEAFMKEIENLKQRLEVLDKDLRKRELEHFNEIMLSGKNEENPKKDENLMLFKLQQENYDKDLKIKDFERSLEEMKGITEGLKERLIQEKEKSLEIQGKILMISAVTQGLEAKIYDLIKENEEKSQEILNLKRKIEGFDEEIMSLKEKNLKKSGENQDIIEFKEKNLVLQEKILMISSLNQSLIEDLKIKDQEIIEKNETIKKITEKNEGNDQEKLKIEIIEKNFQIKSLEKDLNSLQIENSRENQDNYLKLKEKFLSLQENFLLVSALNQAFIEENKQKIKKKVSFSDVSLINDKTLNKNQESFSFSQKSTQVYERYLINFSSKQTQTNNKNPGVLGKSKKQANVSISQKSTQVFERDLMSFQQIPEKDVDLRKNDDEILKIEELYRKFNDTKEIIEKIIILTQIFQRNDLVLYSEILDKIIRESLENIDMRLSDACFELLYKSLVFSRMKIEALSKNNPENLIKIIRTLGKNEDPLLAEKRQSIGLRLLYKLQKKSPDYKFNLQIEILDNYAILETLAVYIENDQGQKENFKKRQQAFILMNNFFFISKEDLEKNTFFITEMKKLNFGLIFIRIFMKSTLKIQASICEFLEMFSRDEEFIETLRNSKKELDLIPEIFLEISEKNLKEFLSFLEKILSNEEIRNLLRGKDDILLNLSVFLLKCKEEPCVRLILDIIEKFLITNEEIKGNFMNKAFLFFNGSLFNILANEFHAEIKIFSLKILDLIIDKISFNSYEIGFLPNLIGIYPESQEKPVSEEIISIIIRLLNETPQNSQILIKSPEILKFLCAEDIPDKYLIPSLVILKVLYSEAKNIQNLNIFAGKSLLTRSISFLKNNDLNVAFDASVLICQMTRDMNYHKNIELEEMELVLQVLKQETGKIKEKEEFIMNLLCMYSNLTYATKFHEWFIKGELISYILNQIFRNVEVPRSPKIRAILIFDNLFQNDQEMKVLKRLLTKEKDENLPILEIFQTFENFHEDPIMNTREFNLWAILKNIDEKMWELERFSQEEIEKMIKSLVNLFYQIDIKVTSNNIKATLNNLIRFKPDLKTKIQKYRDEYKKKIKE